MVGNTVDVYTRSDSLFDVQGEIAFGVIAQSGVVVKIDFEAFESGIRHGFFTIIEI
jgi:hypothetical protein